MTQRKTSVKTQGQVLLTQAKVYQSFLASECQSGERSLSRAELLRIRSKFFGELFPTPTQGCKFENLSVWRRTHLTALPHVKKQLAEIGLSIVRRHLRWFDRKDWELMNWLLKKLTGKVGAYKCASKQDATKIKKQWREIRGIPMNSRKPLKGV